MTDFDERFRELTHEMDVVLDEDLASLQKMDDQSRIERYNTLKSKEETFVWDFSKEHQSLTSEESDEIRSKFRLARLVLAASFYERGNLPRAMKDDFIEAELQAVVDFERYKRFDVLSDSEIEEKIRRMEGEVYELVTEYTSTQIANMDELMDNPAVQQDVIRKLLDRYQERREKIRRGFYVYVETHGMEHMVESIEAAVQAVSEASDEREAIREELQAQLEDLSTSFEQDLRQQQRAIEAQFQTVERKIDTQSVDRADLQEELRRIEGQEDSLSAAQREAIEELNDRIDKTASLEERLEEKIDELERVKHEAAENARESAREETTDLVEDELEALREERERLQSEVQGLEREREGIETARDRLEERQTDLESQVSEVRESLSGEDGGLPEDVVSASEARLLELDYVGRIDTSMHDVDEVSTPDGPREIPDGYWEGRSEHRHDRTRLDSLLPAEGTPEDYPMNRRARYEVTRSKFFGLSSTPEMVLEGAVETNLEAYAKNGFDARPMDLDDLLAAVNDAVFEAEHNDYHYLLALASPTGWTDRVLAQVENDDLARTRYSRDLSLLLVDLRTGEIVHDPTDKVAKRNRHLFEIPIPDERVEECVRRLRANYVDEVGVDNVLLEEVVEDEGFDVRVARRAFERLEAEGVGEQLHVDEYGLALALE
ncbi:MAG: putative nucleic acid-binding Zn-ribbon protein [Haloarculaceae archaeon]|jgi:predicted  nucleic acid-binding Zn-ribbon protein